MTCSTCAYWNLRARPSHAALHLAPCKHGPKWEFLPTHATCGRWEKLPPDLAEKRAAWLAQLYEAHVNGEVVLAAADQPRLLDV